MWYITSTVYGLELKVLRIIMYLFLELMETRTKTTLLWRCSIPEKCHLDFESLARTTMVAIKVHPAPLAVKPRSSSHLCATRRRVCDLHGSKW